MYTDGVTEARNESSEMFGLDKLLKVATQPGRTAQDLADLADRAVRGHTGYAEQADDVTMLCMTRR
jgi:serine phosphatase RsbU (regulator of sigma subunit)